MAVTCIAGRNRTVEIEDGIVRAILPGDPADDRWVVPGLVDLQVNGYRGHDLNEPGVTPGTVHALADALLRTGTTSFLATVITASEERMLAAVSAIARACEQDAATASAVAGIHVEGPHVSPNDGPRGAHPLEAVRAPDLALFDRMQRAAVGLIRVVTLSPHWPDAPAAIAGMVSRGVRVAIGHTDASPGQIAAAVTAGASLSTHLGNGVAATLPRHPNLIWAQLADDRLTATFIGDGHHLPADTLKAMVRAKGERAVLVSDVTALGGMPPGIYRQSIGGEVELSSTGRISLRGTPYLAGAALNLADGVAVAAGVLGLETALVMATERPGAILGGGRGTLAVGRPADLVRFRWSPGNTSLALDTVIAAGVSVPVAGAAG